LNPAIKSSRTTTNLCKKTLSLSTQAIIVLRTIIAMGKGTMAMLTRFNTTKRRKSLNLGLKSPKFRAFFIGPSLLLSLLGLLSGMRANSMLLSLKLAVLAKKKIFTNLTPKKLKTSIGLTTPKNKKSFFPVSVLKRVNLSFRLYKY
jgi:hypothetical protein